MRLTVECLGRTHALRFARLDRPVRSLAKAVAKAAGVERVVLEADGGVLDGAAKVSAVLADGQNLVARVPLDLPYDEFDVVVVDFGRAGSGAPSCSPEAPAWVCSRSDVERRAANAVLGSPTSVAAHPREAGPHVVRWGDLERSFTAVAARRPAPWQTLRPAARARVLRWLKAQGVDAATDRVDAAQLPLPRVDAADDAAPVAWRRPAAGEVVVLPDFVDEALARKIVNAARKRLAASGLMGDGGGAARPAASGYRSNRAAFLTDASGAGAVLGALRRITRRYFPEVPPADVEFQVVHYRAGEEYRLHHDVLRRDADGAFPRRTSLFVYLARADAGGGTAFPRLTTSGGDALEGGGSLFLPPVRSALCWSNVDGDRPDRRAEHAGAPVLAGEKWGLNVWLPAPATRATETLRVALPIDELGARIGDVDVGPLPGPFAAPAPRPDPDLLRRAERSLPDETRRLYERPGSDYVVQLALRTVTRVADGLGHRTLELRCVLPRAVKKATVAALEDAGKAFGVTFAMAPGMVRWV